VRGTPDVFSDFHGGLNTKTAPYGLRNDQARDVLNVVSTQSGAIRKRDGCTAFASPGAGVTGLFPVDIPNKRLLVQSGTSIWRVDPAAAVTALAALPSGGRWEWVQAPAQGGQGPVYGGNGTDRRYFDGANHGAWTATSGTVPPCKFFVYAGNRIFAAGDPNFPSRLYWCDIQNPRVWLVEDVEDFDAFDGGSITGLGTLGPYVLVFKERKIFRVYDLDDGANVRIADNVGTPAHRSIVETPGGTFFLGLDGIYRVQPDGTTVERMSDLVAPTVASIAAAHRSEAAGAYHENHYYLSFASSVAVVNDRTLDYDLQLESWWLHDAAAQQWASWRRVDQPELYQGKASGAVRRAFVPGVSADAGGPSTSFWAGPFWVFGQPQIKKRCKRIRFDGAGHVQVSIAKDFAVGAVLEADLDFFAGDTDFGGTGSFGGDGTFGGEGTVQSGEILTPGVARAWSLKVGSVTDEPWELDSITMAMTTRKD
jgi:hypothetical protein